MYTQPDKSEYLLIFRSSGCYDGMSPEEMQAAAGKFMAWFERLKTEGKAKGGQPLQREGRVVSAKPSGIIADGPFVESKEAIGGYFLLQVADLDEATEIAKSCPALALGMRVEVRPIAAECVTLAEARQRLGEAIPA